MSLLTNREWLIKGNWYAPQEYLQGFKSVKAVELTQTSSSAGDWDGIIFQVVKNKCFVIPFSQENNYPREGFKVYTGDVICKTKADYNKEQIIEQYYQMFY